MDKEMKAIWSNGTWNLVTLSPGHSCISRRWVFTIKNNPDGFVENLKAQLVAGEFTQ